MKGIVTVNRSTENHILNWFRLLDEEVALKLFNAKKVGDKYYISQDFDQPVEFHIPINGFLKDVELITAEDRHNFIMKIKQGYALSYKSKVTFPDKTLSSNSLCFKLARLTAEDKKVFFPEIDPNVDLSCIVMREMKGEK
jgi:hypothetical protein